VHSKSRPEVEMPIIFYDSKDAVPADVAEYATEVKEDGDNKGKWSVNLVPRKKLEEFRDSNVEKAAKLQEAENQRRVAFELLGVKPEEFDADKVREDLAALR